MEVDKITAEGKPGERTEDGPAEEIIHNPSIPLDTREYNPGKRNTPSKSLEGVVHSGDQQGNLSTNS